MSKRLLFLVTSLIFYVTTLAQTSFSTTNSTTNWNTSTTWIQTGGALDADNIPDADDTVSVLSTHTAKVNVNCNAAKVIITSGGILNFNTAAVTLTVGGNLIMQGTASMTGGAAGRLITVGGNFSVAAAATASVSAMDLTVTGTSQIDGQVVFTSATGTKIFTGDVTIGSAGAIDFTAAATLGLTNNINLNAGAAITGSSGTGIINVGGNFSAAAGGTETIAANTFSVTGTSAISGTVTITSTAGTKTLTGDVTMASGGALFYTAGETITMSGNLITNGTNSIDGSATGITNVGGNFTTAATGTVTIGAVTFSVTGTSALNNTISVTSTSGTKSLTGNVTMAATAAVYYSAGETITMAGNLITNGTTSFDGSATGITNVGGNFTTANTGTIVIGAVTFSVTGTSTLSNTLSVTSTSGSKNLTGNVSLANTGAIYFSAGETITMGANLTMNPGSSMDGTSTGAITVAGTFSAITGGTETLGRLTITVASTSQIDGALTFTNGNGTPTFTGNVTIGATGSIYFTAVQTVGLSNNLIMNPGSSIDGTATGVINVGGTFNAVTGGTETIGYGTITVTSTSQIDGTLSITNTNGTKTLTGNVTMSNGSAINFTAGETLAMSGSLTINGTVSMGGTTTGFITLAGNLNIAGTSVLDCSPGLVSITISGNWNVTSTAADPFVEGTSSVTFAGSVGTESISTILAAGETFYNLILANTSATNPGAQFNKNVTITNVLTVTSGTTDLGTYNMVSTGTAAVNAGSVVGTGTLICSGNKATFGTTGGGPTVAPTVSVTVSVVTMQRGTYSGPVYVKKISTASSTDSWRGGNTFNGIFSLTNAAVADTVDPHGDIYMGSNSGDPADVFNANSYFYVTGSARIRIPQSGTATFNSPAHFYSMGFGPSGSSLLTGYDRMQISRIRPAVTTFNDSAILYCSSTTTDMYIAYDSSTTANFNGPTIATHSGTSQANFYFGGYGTINLNNDVYFNNTGTGTIQLTDLTGVATLASGYKLKVGSAGFSSGTLNIKNFTQLGNTSQSLTFTGTASMNIGASGKTTTFNGSVAFSSPKINLSYTTFNGTVNSFTNTGTTNQTCTGGNTFVSGSTSTFVSSSTGYWRLAGTASDDYNGDVVYNRTSTGLLSPAYSTNCTYAGNISIAAGSDSINFANAAGGRIIFDGNTSASFTNNGTKGTSAGNITMNKTSGNFTLNNSIGITTGGNLALSGGKIITSSTGLLFLTDETCSAPAITSSATSYIDGPMRYDVSTNGTTQTLNFPIGKSSDCRPVVLTVRHSAGTSFSYKGEVFNSSAVNLAYSLPATVDTVSGVHYWTMDRTVTSTGAASSNTSLSYSAGTYPLIQLYFDVNDYVYQGSNLTIVKNTSAAPTTWIDIGASCALGNSASPQAGSITSTTSSTPFNSFSTFTLGSKTTGWNSLPVELLTFTAVKKDKQVAIKWSTSTETNNSYFTIERSADAVNFSEIAKVNTKAANGNSLVQLDYSTIDGSPLSGISYYRLKQTNKNGKFKYFNIVSVEFLKDKDVTFSIYPNPNSGEFTVDFSGIENNHEVRIAINDELGREVYASSVYSDSLSSNKFLISPDTKLPAGKYFCTLTMEGIKHTVVLIVN